jgi:RNA polymerase sigma factor (sigma-70 family)
MAAIAPPSDVEVRFESQWRALEPRLRKLARRNADVLKRTSEDEEDVLQEVAVALWRRLSTSRRIDNPFGLACKITRDLGVDRLRKPSATTVELVVPADAGVDPQFDAQVGEREAIRDLDELLAERLDRLERGVLELREQGFSRAEVATQLNVPASEVRVIAQRARRKLRPALEALEAHGRCGMLALTIADIATGRIGPDSPRWEVGRRHLVRCRACRRTVVASRRGDRRHRC